MTTVVLRKIYEKWASCGCKTCASTGLYQANDKKRYELTLKNEYEIRICGNCNRWKPKKIKQN